MAADAPARAWVADIARFIARPSFASAPMAWGRAAALGLVIVFAFDLAIDTLVSLLTDAWDAEAGFLPAELPEDMTPAGDIFASLLLAPLLEELLFRSWLTGRIAALRFAAYGLCTLGLLIASLLLPPDYALLAAWAGVGVVMAGLIHWGRTRHRDTAVPAWFTRHFHWIVWGSSMLFGLIHLGNYEPLSSPLGLLVVLPQTLGGLLLAYTRTRLGLGAAMLHHAGYNAVFLAAEYGWW